MRVYLLRGQDNFTAHSKIYKRCVYYVNSDQPHPLSHVTNLRYQSGCTHEAALGPLKTDQTPVKQIGSVFDDNLGIIFQVSP